MNDVTEMTETTPTVLYSDYAPQLETLIEKQSEQIELLQAQNDILLEQINGFSLIVNYMNGFFCIAIALIVVFILSHVLNKWFFRGC